MPEKVTKIDKDTINIEITTTMTETMSMKRQQIEDEKAEHQVRLTALDGYLTVMNGV